MCPSEHGEEERWLTRHWQWGCTGVETSKVEGEILLVIVFNRHFYQYLIE